MLQTSTASAIKNPFLGSRITYRVAAAPTPSTTAFRQVTTMAKKKGVRLIVTLECTEARAEGGTPSRYVTQKVCARLGLQCAFVDMDRLPQLACSPTALLPQNRRNTPARLELKKYNPHLRRYTLHREIK